MLYKTYGKENYCCKNAQQKEKKISSLPYRFCPSLDYCLVIYLLSLLLSLSLLHSKYSVLHLRSQRTNRLVMSYYSTCIFQLVRLELHLCVIEASCSTRGRCSVGRPLNMDALLPVAALDVSFHY